MTIQQGFELFITGGGGYGLVRVIQSLTKLTDSVDAGAKQITTLVQDLKETKETVQDHEVRISKGGL